jgi:HSP20 family protein
MAWPYFERTFKHWEPWREISQLQQEMNRRLQEYLPEREHFSMTGGDFPALNVWSNDQSIVVTAEIAGLDPENLSITVQDDHLSLRGSRSSKECAEGEIFHRRERGCGEFSRTISLPFKIEADKVDAVYRDGILKVTLPRIEEEKPAKIKIKTA